MNKLECPCPNDVQNV